MKPHVHLLHVFADGSGGGNPAPVVADAEGLSDEQMREIAQLYGHESGFILPSPEGAHCDFELRFWVPNHEMEMCGHVTVGAVWLLDRLGRLPAPVVRILTRSGPVTARVIRGGGAQVEITQPLGRVERLVDAAIRNEIRSVIGAETEGLSAQPIQNASTSRVKTLIPMASVEALNALAPDFSRVESLCERIGSTGLYPYAADQHREAVYHARQFPKSSGYPEDAATGIAAAALAFGLLEHGLCHSDGPPIRVLQGQAMGRPSAITVRFRQEDGRLAGCWLGGPVEISDRTAAHSQRL